MTEIAGGLFEGCSSLPSITIPKSITNIGRIAFYHCDALTSIISDILEPFPLSDEMIFSDETYSIAVLTVPKGTKTAYKSTEGWNKFSKIVEVDEVLFYTLSITAIGNGSASYSGTTAKNNTQSFTQNEGTSATITFSPDNGYRIKSVKVNSVDVTSSLSNKSYTINNISANTTVEVIFEAIPIPAYTLSVKAIGNGSASYNGTTVKNNTQTFTLNDGISPTITFSPDDGYRIKSVNVNSIDVTSSVSNGQYTVSSIKANTTVEVEFEAIPTYTLSVKSTGNGSVIYDGTSAKNNTQTFTLNEGASPTITFSPDSGYRIKSVKVNSTDVFSSISNNQYVVSNIKANTTVEVEFEAIPIPTYTLSVKSTGNGSVTYDGTTAKNNTKTFTLNKGTSPAITFSSDDGYRIKSVKVNSTDVTSMVSNNQYIINNICLNTTVEVEYEKIPDDLPTFIVTVVSEGEYGYIICSNDQVRNETKTFTVEEGGRFTITAIPDEGYRVKSIHVEKNGYIGSTWDYTDKESKNQSHTVYNIKTDVIFKILFEKIPQISPFYTVTITSEGDHGYVSCANGQVKNETREFIVEEGDNYTITAIPDEGYRVKSIHVEKNGYLGRTWDYTDKESVSQYNTAYNIKTDVIFKILFEKIPNISPSYTVTITSEGDHGYVSCDNGQIKNDTKEFTVEESDNFTITAIPDEGYRVKSIHVEKNGYIGSTWDYTDKESKNQSHTVYNIKTDVIFIVKFEEIHESNTLYTVSLTSNTNYGQIKYSGDVVRNSTKTVNIEKGADVSILVIPDEGYRVKSIIRKVEGTDAEIWNYSDETSTEHSFTLYSVSKDQTIEVNFEQIPGDVDENIYLSINQSDGESVKLLVERGEIVKLQIKATDNCRIRSVYFNGNDVTSQLTDGYFTTPAIYQNVELNIIYDSYNSLNDNVSTFDEDVKITLRQGDICIDDVVPDAEINIPTNNGDSLNMMLPLYSR